MYYIHSGIAIKFYTKIQTLKLYNIHHTILRPIIPSDNPILAIFERKTRKSKASRLTRAARQCRLPAISCPLFCFAWKQRPSGPKILCACPKARDYLKRAPSARRPTNVPPRATKCHTRDRESDAF